MPDTSRRNRMTRRMALPAVALLVLLAAQCLLAGLPVAQAQQAGANQPAPAGKGLPAPLTKDDFMRMLPPTDMGAGSASRRMAILDGTPALPFSAARPANNPLAPHAMPIGAKSCQSCHALEDVQASHSLHVTAFAAGAGEPRRRARASPATAPARSMRSGRKRAA